jgi:hypothetical protein
MVVTINEEPNSQSLNPNSLQVESVTAEDCASQLTNMNYDTKVAKSRDNDYLFLPFYSNNNH